ncbi:hypothetical protein MXB_2385 [Myxobolus squamalis]|nr:hypothetical protein MXB_2385 [Myxobolus squamalis]
MEDIIKQIISGINYIHKLNIIHRDLKPSNILISNQKVVKIADFGMAIPFLNETKMETDIVTLGYRSPELLLGATVYNHSIDIWSVGCIFAELANDGIPIFSSTTIDGQLKQIFCVLGLPSKMEWADFETLPKASEFIGKPIKKISIKCIEKRLDLLGTNLLHVKHILFLGKGLINIESKK